MRKLTYTLFCALAICFTTEAQDRSIEFLDNRPWQEVLAAARKADKFIFIDCYTDWCGPCKRLAREVFTVNEVADLFNENFINAKYEMEKSDDGPALGEKYSVEAYPTMLFINPHTEEYEYVIVGAMAGHEWLIRDAMNVLNPETSFSGIRRRYESGERSPELVSAYIKQLGAVSEYDLAAEVKNEYLGLLSDEDFYTEGTWSVITQSLMDPLSDHFPRVVDNRERFYPVAGQEEVNKFLSASVKRATEQIVHPIWYPQAFRKVDNAEQTHADLLRVYAGLDYPPARTGYEFLTNSLLATQGRWDEMLERIEQTLRTDVIAEDQIFDYLRYVIIPLGRDGGNAAQVERGSAILDNMIERYEDWEKKRPYDDLKNQLNYRFQEVNK